jgi:hypothetical protein
LLQGQSQRRFGRRAAPWLRFEKYRPHRLKAHRIGQSDCVPVAPSRSVEEIVGV